MEACFASCLAFTRTEEGGYVNDRRDSGNWTSGRVGEGNLVGSNMGVGAPALARWMGRGSQVTAEQMRDLPLSTYEAIARSMYWTPLGCSMLPLGVDLMVFDFGWNRGIATSLNILSRCMGVNQRQTKPLSTEAIGDALPRVPPESTLRQIDPTGIKILQQQLGVREDGIAGPETERQFKIRQDLWGITIILALSTAQVISYRRLTNFPIYGAGWLTRTSHRQAAALSLAQHALPQKSKAALAAV